MVKRLYVLHSIKFQNIMSLYEYVYVEWSQELSVELYILHEETNIRVSTISVPTVLQVYIFENLDLLSQAPGDVMFTSFKHCLHFVGRWQTV